MKKQRKTFIDIEIDKLTNSIENTLTGEVFETEITRLTYKTRREIKSVDWQFDWHKEINDSSREVYKLTTMNNPLIIHGLICFTERRDHIFIHLIESAKFNKGRKKQYSGVAGNLVAFCCKVAFERQLDGAVSFIAKTLLIEHYQQTLGAKHFRGNRMFIETKEAVTLVQQYFKDFDYGKL